MVEMGTDRIHHGFWKYMDSEHRKHVPGNPYENAILDYYRHVDGLVGDLMHADEDTVVLVVSDHGAKRLDGGIRINEFLRREGLLTPRREPDGTTTLEKLGVDWSRTVAWGEEATTRASSSTSRAVSRRGSSRPGDYERVRNELAEKLATIPDDLGRPMGTVVYKPEELYATANGVPPDLIVLFGDLFWSVGTLGGDEGIHAFENDTGPDDNHAQDGLLIMAGEGIEPGSGKACTCSMSPRPFSICSASRARRRCVAEAFSRCAPFVGRRRLRRSRSSATIAR